MSLDFLQIQTQIREFGAEAVSLAPVLEERYQRARQLFNSAVIDLDRLRNKVQELAETRDKTLRCAIPAEFNSESLNGHFPCPQMPSSGVMIAADGSQINPDRHAEVNYCLINVGAIQMNLESTQAPQTVIRSQLIFGEQLYEGRQTMTEASVALQRDLNERRILAELGAQAEADPVITFTDGPLELWGPKESDPAGKFQQHLQEYLQALSKLRDLRAITAGYVDRPASNLVVRLLEIAMLSEDQFGQLRRWDPLQGVTDLGLFADLLHPGERSAVFTLQSGSSDLYREDLSLHFFYLNVSTPSRKRKLARVEIPGWVAREDNLVNALQAALFSQCQILGGLAYPYLLQRAHEIAVVTHAEREQVTQMMQMELLRRGMAMGEKSEKQTGKVILS
jgi:hypothetical protein